MEAASMAESGQAKMIIQRLVYSPEEAGEMLSICRDEVYGLLRTGEIHGYKHGQLTRIPHEELVAYKDRMMREHPVDLREIGG